MKYLYIVDHFVPFPQSEYGGIWNVLASDDEECFHLITEQYDDLNLPYNKKLKERYHDLSRPSRERFRVNVISEEHLCDDVIKYIHLFV